MSAFEDSTGEQTQPDSAQVDTVSGAGGIIGEDILQDGLSPITDLTTSDDMTGSESETSNTYRPSISLADKGKQRAYEDQDYDMDAEGLEHEDRPNRYYGPSSTWMSWTAKDRQIVESLLELRNRDLSAHLYNAHALKIRKQRAAARVNSETVLDPSYDFIPSKVWTAWPMPPSEVPRSSVDSTANTVDEEKYGPTTGSQATADLEDCLLAHTLRVAKGTFNARQFEDGHPGESRGEPVQSLSGPRPDASAEDTHIPTFSSQAYRDSSQEESSDTREAQSPNRTHRNKIYDLEGNTIPVFLADDEEARKLFNPTIQKTLNHLDNLLDSLHVSRHSYTARSDDSNDDEDIRSSINRHRSRSRSRFRRRSRSGAAKRRRSDSTDEDRSATKSSSRASRGGEAYSATTTRFALRDWSEIMAFAAISGWDSEVVTRAAQRCANLFEEDMQFRTFSEGSRLKKEPSYFTESTAQGFEPDAQHYNKSRQHADGRYFCPYVSCRGRGREFKNAQTLDQHIRNYHSISQSPFDASSQDLTDTQMSNTGGEEQSHAKYLCPVIACKRHTTPFSRSTKMYSHVRIVHPEIDLDEVKRLEIERRGERRGRSSKRSRSSQAVDRSGS